MGKHSVTDVERNKLVAVFAMIVITSLVGAFVVYRLARAMPPAALHFQNIRLSRLTAEGTIKSVAVSADEKYLA